MSVTGVPIDVIHCQPRLETAGRWSVREVEGRKDLTLEQKRKLLRTTTPRASTIWSRGGVDGPARRPWGSGSGEGVA
jgi:hypothetical protein